MGKRYYWLKLQNTFLDSLEMKKLRLLAGGSTYIIIYLKMLLASIDNEGVIEFKEVENTIEKELALQINEQEIDITATLLFLEKFKLVEKMENNDVLFNYAIKNIGSESESAARVRKYRNKSKAFLDAPNTPLLQCNVDVTNSNTHVTTETDRKTENNQQQKETALIMLKELKIEEPSRSFILNNYTLDTIANGIEFAHKNMNGNIKNKVGWIISCITSNKRIKKCPICFGKGVVEENGKMYLCECQSK